MGWENTMIVCSSTLLECPTLLWSPAMAGVGLSTPQGVSIACFPWKLTILHGSAATSACPSFPHFHGPCCTSLCAPGPMPHVMHWHSLPPSFSCSSGEWPFLWEFLPPPPVIPFGCILSPELLLHVLPHTHLSCTFWFLLLAAKPPWELNEWSRYLLALGERWERRRGHGGREIAGLVSKQSDSPLTVGFQLGFLVP